MRRWAPLVVLWLILGVAAAATVRTLTQQPPDPGVPEANDLVLITVEQWPTPQRRDYPADAPPFTVVDSGGRVLVAEGDPVRTDLAALRQRASALGVEVDGARVGTLYLRDAYAATMAGQRREALVGLLLLLTLLGLAATGWLVWLDRRVLAPFRELRGFADKVAGGNLEAPLRVHRSDAFGAFSESFDILRTELARSREREAAAQQARKELVSQLSHDIRTPLATIRATTELLQLTDDDPRLSLIADKAMQIESLTQELFDANAEELETLPVTLTAIGTPEIADMVTAADDAAWLSRCELPDTMVVADRTRLRQVLDNVLGNARKYAAPPVEVTGAIDGDLLVLRVLDHGDGVPDDELPLIARRHYRARNAAGHPGQGLGLHTAAGLMERMGGDLSTTNTPDSFVVSLTLARAERAHDPRRHAF